MILGEPPYTIRVVRFLYYEVVNNINGVMRAIDPAISDV